MNRTTGLELIGPELVKSEIVKPRFTGPELKEAEIIESTLTEAQWPTMAIFVVSSSGDDYEQVKKSQLETMIPKGERYVFRFGPRNKESKSPHEIPALVLPKYHQ